MEPSRKSKKGRSMDDFCRYMCGLSLENEDDRKEWDQAASEAFERLDIGASMVADQASIDALRGVRIMNLLDRDSKPVTFESVNDATTVIAPVSIPQQQEEEEEEEVEEIGPCRATARLTPADLFNMCPMVTTFSSYLIDSTPECRHREPEVVSCTEEVDEVLEVYWSPEIEQGVQELSSTKMIEGQVLKSGTYCPSELSRMDLHVLGQMCEESFPYLVPSQIVCRSVAFKNTYFRGAHVCIAYRKRNPTYVHVFEGPGLRATMRAFVFMSVMVTTRSYFIHGLMYRSWLHYHKWRDRHPGKVPHVVPYRRAQADKERRNGKWRIDRV